MVAVCNITGNLLDSGIIAIGATLEVTADAYIVDDTTTPDSVILPAPRTFTIPNTGVIDIDLPRTEPSRTAYTFKLNAPGYFLQWKTVIPDQADVEFASLLPTTVTTDRSSTSVYLIARELATNPRLLPALVNGLGIVKQNSPPAGPVAGEPNVIWVDTSTGWAWNWDATEEMWLSPYFPLTLETMDASAGVSLKRHLPNPIGSGLVRIETISLRWNVQAAPNDSSNRWDMQPQYRLTSSATPVNIGAAVPSNPAGYVVATARTQNITVGSNFSYAALDAFLFNLAKVGSPGNINVSCTFNYRFFTE